jgi:addiction module HigA family antidote
MSIPRKPNSHMPPMHPGEILREEFMVPFGLSANAVAIALRVPATRILEIINERRGITADTALRLGLYFKTSAELWMSLQQSYELALAQEQLLPKIVREVQPRESDRRTRKTA